jgi:hypothetical protein
MIAPVYTFTFKELVRALCRDAGLTSGEWTAIPQRNADAIAAGPTPEKTWPGVFVAVIGYALVEATIDTPEHLLFDANELWPPP